MEQGQYISRTEAATMLQVSLRTLDRYIRRKGMHTKREGKNILIAVSDLRRMGGRFSLEGEVVDQINKDFPTATPEEKTTRDFLPATMEQDRTWLKDLLEEYHKQLARKEEKIELLNYKLGQMEMKLKQSVPLLEHKQSSQNLEQKVQQQETLIYSLSQKQTGLTIAKNIYLVLFLATIIGGSLLWVWLHP